MKRIITIPFTKDDLLQSAYEAQLADAGDGEPTDWKIVVEHAGQRIEIPAAAHESTVVLTLENVMGSRKCG